MVAFGLAICAPFSATAQVLYGSIVGNVNDSSGSAVPDANVTIVEATTGDVTVTKTGFSSFSRADLSVSPNSVSRLDVSLEVGAVTETIRVDAAPVMLQTDRAEVRSEILTPI